MSELLNDDSFIYWVKKDERLSDSDKEKWDKWLSSQKKNADLLNKAKKIIDMPFKEIDSDCHRSGELDRLREAVKKADEDAED